MISPFLSVWFKCVLSFFPISVERPLPQEPLGGQDHHSLQNFKAPKGFHWNKFVHVNEYPLYRPLKKLTALLTRSIFPSKATETLRVHKFQKTIYRVRIISTRQWIVGNCFRRDERRYTSRNPLSRGRPGLLSCDSSCLWHFLTGAVFKLFGFVIVRRHL